MKKVTLILVMVFCATLAYNQSSRRTTNNSSQADRTRANRTSQSTTYASSDRNNRSTTTTTTTTTHRVEHRAPQRTHTSATTQRSHSNEYKQAKTHHNHSNHKAHHNKTHAHHTSHTTVYKHRTPVHVDIVWTRDMHRHYVSMYPTHHNWHGHHYGTRISTIPAREADCYIGYVKTVYGRVTDAYYSRRTDEFILTVGRHAHRQQFTVVIPGNIARRHSYRPIDYYLYQDIYVTGLISSHNGDPEMIVRRNSQVQLY